MKVLITDDSLTVRMILKGLLKQLEILDVTEAPNGSVCLSLLKQSSFDLLLLDLHMPIMDGFECLRELKANPQTAQLPVIVISSDSTPDQMQEVRNLGVKHFVTKPFRPQALQEAIRTTVPGQ